MAFEKGVRYYTRAIAMIEIAFPENKTVCQYCTLSWQDRMGKVKCMLSDEIIPYPNVQVGKKCPFEIVDLLEEKAEMEAGNG